MAALQIVFRAWALYPSWFFADDYVLLHDALGTPVTPGYLFSDFNSNLIPAVRLLASLVVGSGELNWPLAATIVLILQALANVAALTMLTSLFGPRWAILAPFALYLSSAVTMPAFMWWVAAVSQLPFQAAFFFAVTAWVAYLRTHRWRWLAVTILVLVISLFCYTKSVLIAPVLAYVLIAYFAEGDLRRRVVTCLRRYWAAAVLGGAVTAVYVVYYVTQVPQPFENPDRGQFADVIETVLGSSFPTSLLGGPWRWWDTTPPVVLASPPDWAVSLSWVLIAGIVAYSVLTRSRVVVGWFLLLAYATGLGLLLASSRGQLYGQLSGLEYRYLTDVICVATLTLALVFLPLLGAPGASEPRAQRLLLIAPRPGVVIGIVAAISIGGVLSTARYVNFWHTSNASREYVHNLQRDLKETPAPQLADQLMPREVMPDYTTPVNTTEVFTQLLEAQTSFPETTDKLQLIDDHGNLSEAAIRTGVTSRPGPVANCGWKVGTAGRTIPLTGSTFDYGWWLRIGYLASGDSPVTVTAGDTDVRGSMHRGLHSLFLRADGEFDEVTISGLTPGTRVCVDTIEVGFPEVWTSPS
jgi:hypothetical protein